MIKRSSLYVIFVAILSQGILFASDITSFLNISSGPMIAGQGYTAIANVSGIDAIKENPAALSQSQGRLLSQLSHFTAYETEYVTADLLYAPTRTGVRYVRSSMASIPKSSISNGLVVESEETYAFKGEGVYVSQQLLNTTYFKLGMSVYWASVTIDDSVLDGIGSQIGILVPILKKTQLGMGINNLFTVPFRYQGSVHKLDQTLRLGLSHKLYRDKITLSSDIVDMTNEFNVRLGMRIDVDSMAVVVGTYDDNVTIGAQLRLPRLSFGVSYEYPNLFDKDEKNLDMDFFKFAIEVSLDKRNNQGAASQEMINDGDKQ